MSKLFPRDIVTPRKGEYIGGGIYWACYLFGLSLLLSFIMVVMNINVYSDAANYLLNIAYFVINFIAVALIFRNFLYRSFVPIRHFGRFLLTVLISYGVYYALSLQISIIYDLFELYPENQNQEGIDGLFLQQPWVMVLCTVIFVPITEECLCRGLIFAPLCRKIPWLAYAVSSLVFSLLHVIGSFGTAPISEIILNIIIYLPAGIALGYAYQRTRSIWGAIVLHSVINLLSVLGTYFLV